MRRALCCLLLIAAPGAAQELTVDEVLARHVEARGGAEALAAIRTLKKTGTYVYNGNEYALASYRAREGSWREEIEGLDQWGTQVMDDRRVIHAAHDGVAWSAGESEELAPSRLEGKAARPLLELSDFDGPLINSRKKRHEVELAGEGDVDGSPSLKLRVTLADGSVHFWHLDPESYLVLKRETEVPFGFETIQEGRAWHFDDYREVGGVMLPFWEHIEEGLFSREYIYESIEPNVEIDAALFQPPAPTEKASDSKP